MEIIHSENNIHNVTTDARLQEVACEMDAKQMTGWVEDIRSRHASGIRQEHYQSVFRCFNIDGGDVLIGAVGRLIGLRIFVSRSAVTGEIDLDGQVVFTSEIKSETGFESIPFENVFALCGRLRDAIRKGIDPRYYCVPFVGGIRSIFLCDEPQEMVNYYLPEIELFGDGHVFRLFAAAHISDDIPLAAQAPRTGKSCCQLIKKTEYPDRPEYSARMRRVLDELKSDALQKIVIARKCTLVPDTDFDMRDYAAYLYDRYFQEYFYLFRQGEDACWVGISPEIIMKQKGRTAVTKPLAGTRKKSDNEAENIRIREELTHTDKDIIEHEHALYFMVQQLEKAGIGSIEIKRNKSVFETPYAFHMKSEISIQLNEQASCFDIIGAIYPPATVWGIPVDRTEWLLAKTEPFAREYFTGVYGYWNYEGDADAALVIRSARIDDGSVSLYAGGGIVKYSDIDAEFDETVNKMRPLFGYFKEVL
ncbi:MAG: chorismate-binding protein [Clostridiales bacterium]|nr:chorismate-binding protein [Clostridiales bacterium]